MTTANVVAAANDDGGEAWHLVVMRALVKKLLVRTCLVAWRLAASLANRRRIAAGLVRRQLGYRYSNLAPKKKIEMHCICSLNHKQLH